MCVCVCVCVQVLAHEINHGYKYCIVLCETFNGKQVRAWLCVCVCVCVYTVQGTTVHVCMRTQDAMGRRARVCFS